MFKRRGGDADRSDRALVRFAAWFCLFLFGSLLAIGGPLYAADIPLFEENGPIECLQLALLFVGANLFGLRLRSPTPLHSFYQVLMVLYLSLFLRELDVRELGWPSMITWILGPGRVFWLTALWALVSIRLWFSRKTVLYMLRASDLNYLLRLSVLLVSFYVLSSLAERGVSLPIGDGREFAEELLETVFEWCLVAFALLAIRLRTNPSRWMDEDTTRAVSI